MFLAKLLLAEFIRHVIAQSGLESRIVPFTHQSMRPAPLITNSSTNFGAYFFKSRNLHIKFAKLVTFFNECFNMLFLFLDDSV